MLGNMGAYARVHACTGNCGTHKISPTSGKSLELKQRKSIVNHNPFKVASVLNAMITKQDTTFKRYISYWFYGSTCSQNANTETPHTLVGLGSVALAASVTFPGAAA